MAIRGGRIGSKAVMGGSGFWSLRDIQQELGAGTWGAPGSAANPASSATALRNSGITSNGAYWYQIPGGSNVRLYTDFTTFPSYSFVLVNRFSAADHFQYLTTSNFQEDLTVANTTAPTRSAKISDQDYNTIVVSNTIKWVIGSNKQIFYRHNDSWSSNFGQVASCGYTTSHFSSYSSASNSPSWNSFSNYSGACGGGYSNDWLILTGIHVNDPNYKGMYLGSGTGLTNAPTEYTTSTGSGWSMPGYAFLSW